MAQLERYFRPRAYEDEVYQWYLGKVPKKTTVDGKQVDNPAYTNAIFVVHGMGLQKLSDTAAVLRIGFEGALEGIHEEIVRHNQTPPLKAEETPSPFIYEGYWGNYENIEKNFPEDWNKLDEGKREFFCRLWKQRAVSSWRTYRWLIAQLFRLIKPSNIWTIGFLRWFLYVLLLIIAGAVLSIFLLRYRKILSQVLGDVRLYVAPEGIVERAIVQRIDKRVGGAFLQMLGLDWDFRSLPDKGDPEIPDEQKIQSVGKPVEFDRIAWVAHSLGTVISYNVLSDLFHRANEIAINGTEIQKQNVAKFRNALRRFITMGSPLDKIAFLFGKEVIRPWPSGARDALLDGGETIEIGKGITVKDWWINFFHFLDPVSGALDSDLICASQPPVNYHIGFFRLPGLAHIAYWNEQSVLEYILSRVYGKQFLPLEPKKPMTARTLTWISVLGYLIWTGIIVGALFGIGYVLFHPQMWKTWWGSIFTFFGF